MKKSAKCPNRALLKLKIIFEEEIAHNPVFRLGQDGVNEMF
jgi:hypothetical protein